MIYGFTQSSNMYKGVQEVQSKCLCHARMSSGVQSLWGIIKLYTIVVGKKEQRFLYNMVHTSHTMMYEKKKNTRLKPQSAEKKSTFHLLLRRTNSRWNKDSLHYFLTQEGKKTVLATHGNVLWRKMFLKETVLARLTNIIKYYLWGIRNFTEFRWD